MKQKFAERREMSDQGSGERRAGRVEVAFGHANRIPTHPSHSSPTTRLCLADATMDAVLRGKGRQALKAYQSTGCSSCSAVCCSKDTLEKLIICLCTQGLQFIAHAKPK